MLKTISTVLILIQAFIVCVYCENVRYSRENEIENSTLAAVLCREKADCESNLICRENRSKCTLTCGGKGKCTVTCSSTCVCEDNKVWDKSENKCRAPCDKNCNHDGECKSDKDDDSLKFCKCNEGTSGDLCDIVDDCTNETFCEHKEIMKCVYNGKDGGKCVCKESGKFFDSVENECRTPCDKNCKYDGECKSDKDDDSLKFCKCREGTSGVLCDIVDDCIDENFCEHKEILKCVYNGKDGGICVCKESGKFFDSVKNECRIIDPCSPDPCKNEGQCLKEGNKAKCMCKPAFTGEFCETDTCGEGIICKNYQKCINTPLGVKKCACPPEKSGEKCNIIDACEKGGTYENCEKSDCKYDDTKEYAYCDCGTDRMWDILQNKCSDTCGEGVICKNYQKCINEPLGVKKCACPPGKSGEQCNTIDACEKGGKYENCKKSDCKYDDTNEYAYCDCGTNRMWDILQNKCSERCKVKCGEKPGVICTGTLDSDANTVCGCTDDKHVFVEGETACKERCKVKCGEAPGVKCTGTLDSDANTVCACTDDKDVYVEGESVCKERCKVKCGEKPGVTCTGTLESFENTVCACTDEKNVYVEDGRECKERCKVKCGEKPGVTCTGTLDSDENTVCACINDKYVYVEDSRECKVLDPCSPNPCLNGGFCANYKGIARCTCINGYTGDTCEIEFDPCSENPCVNDGICYNYGGYGRCKCKTGYSGDNCEIKLDPCFPNPCLNEGICYYYEGLGRCKCKTGYSGERCEIDLDPCSPNPCLNGGFCADYRGIARCTCRNGYSGDKCEIVKDPCIPNPCINDGNCSKFEGTARCICKNGYSGDKCETVKDVCIPNPCLNNGNCSESEGTARCVCEIGYFGDKCETFDRCLPNPCKNGGICSNIKETYKCDCVEFYGGKDCSENIWCDKYGEKLCGKAKCQYNGRIGRGHCVCEVGKVFNQTTKTCTDLCIPNPCRNGGLCYIEYDEATCKCKSPFSGAFCETDPCYSNPCQNGGTCLVEGTAFKCICKDRFSGATCGMDNNWMLAAVLAIVVILALILLCGACIGLRINQNLKKITRKSV